MAKPKIIDQNSERSILQERLFLSKMNNPFLVNMLCSFQDKDYLYLVLQLFTGGDLRYHLTNYIYSFTETQLKFLMSHIVLGLQYIHSKGILHRDLKPENILFDDKGYAYITDFGIAWSNDEDHEGDNSGTPGYMAPETLFGLSQDYCVDFYSLGVIGYEIIMGKTPYDGNSRHEIKKQMHEKNVYIDYDDVENFSEICVEFINGLLTKNPGKRLGAESGVSEIKDNIFFRGINWELIFQHKYLSPIVDIINFSKIREGEAEELFDIDYCKRKESVNQTTIERYDQIKNGRYYSKYFRNYSFLCVDNILKELPMKKKVKVVKRVPVNNPNNMDNKNNNNNNNNNIINNNKMLRRSQSIDNNNRIFFPNINSPNNNQIYNNNEQQKVDDKYQGKKMVKNASLTDLKKYRDKLALKLPYIKNKFLKYNKDREKKIKNFYENKLGKCKNILKKLHSNYLAKAKELNKQYKNNNEKKYKIYHINKDPPQKIQESPNLNYNNQMIPNNNLNCYNCHNCHNCNHCNHCNCNSICSYSSCSCNCNYSCNLNCNNINPYDMDFYLKMNRNRDNFFAKYNDSDDDDDRDLYEQNLIERCRLIPREIMRNRIRYITEGRIGPDVEIVVTSTDEEEEEEEEIEIEEPPPPQNQIIEKQIPEIRIQKIKYKPKIRVITITKTFTKTIYKTKRKNSRKRDKS